MNTSIFSQYVVLQNQNNMDGVRGSGVQVGSSHGQNSAIHWPPPPSDLYWVFRIEEVEQVKCHFLNRKNYPSLNAIDFHDGKMKKALGKVNLFLICFLHVVKWIAFSMCKDSVQEQHTLSLWGKERSQNGSTNLCNRILAINNYYRLMRIYWLLFYPYKLAFLLYYISLIRINP